MSEREEVLLEPAFVLHHRPFRNSSQIVDCLTQMHGRIGLVARSGQRPERRALLQPFVPLTISWVRRGELGNLTHAEPAGTSLALHGDALLAGFYINELALRLLARGDANRDAFSCYSACVRELAGGTSPARSLRLFELDLLCALGYALELRCDVDSGEPLAADRSYAFEIESGPRRVPDGAADGFRGKDLIALRDRALDDQESLRAAKALLGGALRTYLGERPLKSRGVVKDIVARGLHR